ncbi:MAG: hypothetical protein V1914_00540 [archaeon]
MFYNLLFIREFGEPHLTNMPEWVFTLYNVSHSLILAAIAIILISLYLKKIHWYMLAWPVAITMDLFTHTREFLPTPFLWPISEWKFPGTSWGNGYFMLINITVMAIAFIYIYKKKKK